MRALEPPPSVSASPERRLEEQERLLSLLGEVSQLALSGEFPDSFAPVAECIARSFPVAAASIVIVDEDRGHLSVAAQYGDIHLSAPDQWSTDVGVCGRAVRTGQTQLILEPESDADYFPLHPKVRSELIVPIRNRGTILGALVLESLEKHVFSPQACTALECVADQLGGGLFLSLANQRLEAQQKNLEEANAELRELNRRLRHRAEIDGLTGIGNRQTFDKMLAVLAERARKASRGLGVALADIDHFKALNDHYGHQRGDECLRRVAHALLGCGADVVARYGGEEFALILYGSDRERCLECAHSIRQRVAALDMKHEWAGGAGHVTISVGAAFQSPCRSKPERLVAEADAAMYAAKDAGRDRVVFRSLSRPA